jgi:hypothetical protein
MTQRRNDPDRLSNYFDRLLQGIGHRGSSFSDVDAITHDEFGDRFLFQEFKRADEPLNRGQRRLLMGLARQSYCTVWCVRLMADGNLEWCDVETRTRAILTPTAYCEKFRHWWAGAKPIPSKVEVRPVQPPTVGEPEVMHESEIDWSFGDRRPVPPDKKKDDAA